MGTLNCLHNFTIILLALYLLSTLCVVCHEPISVLPNVYTHIYIYIYIYIYIM